MTQPKMIPVVCPGAMEKYNYKRVLFSVLIGRETEERIGEFLIQIDPLRVNIRIEPDLFHSPHSREEIHLSQEAVDSIQPIQHEKFEFVVTAQLKSCLYRNDKP